MAHLPAVTRESIPSFDLYAELEVSRQASVEVIEAAYRTLAKSHHPDVARPADTERIKRLNRAREWLTDPVRRRRYDAATGPEPRAPKSPKSTRAGKPAYEAAERSPWTSSAKAFGPNTDEVRQFLAHLRALDGPRATAIRDGRAAIDPIAYAVARHGAYLDGRAARRDEWLLAREAASVIARGKLGDSPLTPVVSDVVAEIAGAITVRDLIPRNDFDVLLQPWHWRGSPAAAAGAVGAVVAAAPAASTAAAASPEPAPSPAGPASSVASRAERTGPVGFGSSLAGAAADAAAGAAAKTRVGPARRGASTLAAPAVLALVALIALVSVVLTLNGTRPEVAVAGLTDSPSRVPSPPPSFLGSPLATAPAVASPSAATGSFTTAPTGTSVLEPSAGPGPASTPKTTLRPPATAGPTPVPTLLPTPSPTPVPTPSPPVFCQVVSLIGENSANAPAIWNTAGFTGTVDFSPSVPRHYKIGWQSLTAGETVLCTSGITVQKFAP